MIGRRAVLGLSLLSALLLCAFAAQSASAAKSENTTAFTCVSSGGETNKDFKDAHCDEAVTPGTGTFEHKKIKLGETTEIEVSNQKVTNETRDHEPAVLKGKIGLTATEISCTKIKATEGNDLRNEDTTGKHTLVGNANVDYEECTVLKPAKCAVKTPIITKANVVGVEKLGAESNTMGIEFVGNGAEETFTEITFEDTAEKACSLKGQTFKVKGSAIGTCGPGTEADQSTNRKSCGATLVFTPKKEMQKLKFGANTAEFETINTLTMRETNGGPVTATTFT